MNNRHIVRSAGRSPAILAAVLVLLAGWISMPTAHAATRRPADDFVTTVSTQYDWRFTIPTHSDSIYNYNVDCDDDGIDEVVGATGDYTCDYTGDYPGHFPPEVVFPLRIKDNTGTGTGFPRIWFRSAWDADKVETIEQWGRGKWTSMDGAFEGCFNLAGQAVDAPDLSMVRSMRRMFFSTSFNRDIGDWDVSAVTDMSSMFADDNDFNQDIGDWDTSAVQAEIFASFLPFSIK